MENTKIGKTLYELEVGKTYRNTRVMEPETEVMVFVRFDEQQDPIFKPVSGVDFYTLNGEGEIEFFAWALEDELFYEQED